MTITDIILFFFIICGIVLLNREKIERWFANGKDRFFQ